MVGLLLVTHGSFSEGIVTSVELIAGKQEKLRTLTLLHGDDVLELQERVGQEIEELDDGDGVLVLVDIIGGSPSNVTAANLNRKNVECLTGLNLPMLFEALDSRESCKLQEVKTRCMHMAMEGIVDLRSRILTRTQASAG